MNQADEMKGRIGRWMGSLMIAVALVACSRPAPEARLRTTIAGLQKAVEDHDASAIQDAIAEDFIGPEGLDRTGVRRLAQGVFLRYRDVGASLGPLDVDLKSDHARVRFTAVVTGGSGSLPQSGQVYEVETAWRLEGNEWRLVNANWQPRL